MGRLAQALAIFALLGGFALAAPAGPRRSSTLPGVEEAPHGAAQSATAVPLEVAPAPGDSAALRELLAQLTARIDELAAGEAAPPWAVRMEEQLGRRLERVTEMHERLAARIEAPLPRLDEPIILFTVAASTLVLGFVLGRRLQRRRDRRDGRFRL